MPGCRCSPSTTTSSPPATTTARRSCWPPDRTVRGIAGSLPYPVPVTRPALDRRRLLAGGGAAAGLAVLGGCAHPGAPDRSATTSAPAVSAPPTAPASLPVSPTATPSPSPGTVERVEAPRLADRLDDY